MKCFCHYFLLRSFFHFFSSSLLCKFAQKMPVRGVFVIFFYLHADEHGKTRSTLHLQTSFPPWPRGKGKLSFDLSTSFDFSFRGIADRSSPSDRSPIHPKLKSKLGVECRKTLSSTARPRRQTLWPSGFN